MTGGIHLHFEKQRIVVGLESAQTGDVFRWFPIHDLTIVEAAGDKHGGIGALLEIVVGAVGLHVIIRGFLVGVAPFEIFADGEWKGGVHHGVHDVDERYCRVDGAEEIRPEIYDGTHE